MESKKAQDANAKPRVRHLKPIPATLHVAPLSDAEIVKIREMLEGFATIATSCTVAKRLLSQR